jgi:uncharacterized protein
VGLDSRSPIQSTGSWPRTASLPAVQLLSTLQTDLSTALKSKDSMKVSVIRSLLSSIGNAGAVPLASTTDAVGLYAGDSARRSIGNEEVKRLLEDEIAERNDAASAYTDPAAIERMKREAALIEEYLAAL